ncbi:hypothetical protein WA158_001128 [Blastocystis sp. Blastoise]
MELSDYLKRFNDLKYAFAYGSGVFRQTGYTDEEAKKAMIDFIIAVDNTSKWHSINKHLNNQDYSIIKRLPNKTIGKLNNSGGGVYFNTTLVQLEGQRVPRKMKYGVLSMDSLISDLENWDNLYIAGRLHKPVNVILSNDIIRPSFEKNLKHAVHVALCILPTTFTERQLYMAICSLSYMGDIRMGFAENPHKIENIVNGSYSLFHELYEPIIKNCPYISKQGDLFKQDISLSTQSSLLSSLPSSLQPSIQHIFHLPIVKTHHSLEYDAYYGYIHQMNTYPIMNCNKESYYHELSAIAIQKGVSNIVRRSSVTQAVKGTFSLGISKSVVYVTQKMLKALKK